MLLFRCASSVPELSAVQDAEFSSARNSLNDSMYPTGLIPIARSTLIDICSFLSVFKNLTVRPTHPIQLSISCQRPITKLEARIERIARTPHDSRRAFD